LSDLPQVTVRAVAGYLWRHVPQAQILFRGIRTWHKDGPDERHLQILNTWGPLVCGPFWWPRTTYFLQGNPQYNHISSTLIRDICRGQKSAGNALSTRGGATDEASTDNLDLLCQLVPEIIAPQVQQLYGTHVEKSSQNQ